MRVRVKVGSHDRSRLNERIRTINDTSIHITAFFSSKSSKRSNRMDTNREQRLSERADKCTVRVENVPHQAGRPVLSSMNVRMKSEKTAERNVYPSVLFIGRSWLFEVSCRLNGLDRVPHSVGHVIKWCMESENNCSRHPLSKHWISIVQCVQPKWETTSVMEVNPKEW